MGFTMLIYRLHTHVGLARLLHKQLGAVAGECGKDHFVEVVRLIALQQMCRQLGVVFALQHIYIIGCGFDGFAHGHNAAAPTESGRSDG